MEGYLYERKDEAESEMSERKIHWSAKKGPHQQQNKERTQGKRWKVGFNVFRGAKKPRRSK